MEVAGNGYVAYIPGHGSLLPGHSHPGIVDAVSKQILRGAHLGASTEEEIRWAKAIKALVSSKPCTTTRVGHRRRRHNRALISDHSWRRAVPIETGCPYC